MKITGLTTYLVAPRWCFLRIDTDEGVTGWGEPIVEGRAHTVAAAVDEAADYLVGQDPLRIEEHWQVLSKGNFYRGGPVLSSAVAGIDQALWDIAGKVHGVPVYQLLGGHVRDRMRVYGWIGGDRPDVVADAAKNMQNQGFTAIKMNGGGEMRRVDTAAAVSRPGRPGGGDPGGVRARLRHRDRLPRPVHGGHGPADSAAPRALPAVLRRGAARTGADRPDRPDLFLHVDPDRHRGAVVLPVGLQGRAVRGHRDPQPDLSHAGGISEVRRIAAQAEVYDVALAPHCPLGPIALAASLQVDFASPNALIQEQSLGIHYNEGSDLLDYLVDTSVFGFADGYVTRPTKPGLGIEVDEKEVARAAEVGHRWRTPTFRRDDGSLAEW